MTEIKAIKTERINGYTVTFYDNGTAIAKRGDGDCLGGPADWVRRNVWRL